MTTERYSILRAHAAPWMGPAVPRRYYIGRGLPADLPADRTAVYIMEYGDGTVAYVGQTRRGVARRVGQHAETWRRAMDWRYVWVIPLLESVPPRVLGQVEGLAANLL